MNLSNTLEDIGKFFNEILGYLLPGLTLVYLVDFFVGGQRVDLSIASNGVWLVLLMSYVSGYLVYGLSIVEGTIYGKLRGVLCAHKKVRRLLSKAFERCPFWEGAMVDRITTRIQMSEEYRITVMQLKKLIPEMDTQKLNFHSVRNFAMAYVPEVDQKIYTFMFRSDLFEHTKTILMAVSLWGLAGYGSHLFFNNNLMFKVSGYNWVFIVAMLLLTYPLNQGKKRFLDIAYRIQFNIFLAKNFPLKNG